MDYRKLDAALASAFEVTGAATTRFPVFVRINPAFKEAAEPVLRHFGIDAGQGSSILTADLSRDQIDQLADQGWVISIRLGRTARPLT